MPGSSVLAIVPPTVILPASPGFYHQPQTIDDLIDFVVARILNLLGIPQDMLPRWGEHHLSSDE